MDDGAKLYDAFLTHEAALEPHRVYARAVAAATHGSGMTPVRPLAAMGTGGGPLLCDHCRKPIILEGGEYHGVYADEAWRRRASSPTFASLLRDETRADWKSYIKGGMVVDTETNGTLRIYHGYPHTPNSCLHRAEAARREAKGRVDDARRGRQRGPLLAFLKAKFPALSDIERGALAGQVLDAMCGFDPGIGINRPEATNDRQS